MQVTYSDEEETRYGKPLCILCYQPETDTLHIRCGGHTDDEARIMMSILDTFITFKNKVKYGEEK